MRNALTARAKVNLCLHVTGQRADGYHLLDSLVAFADFGDFLTFVPHEAVSLTIDGPFSGGLAGAQDNLILQAARCYQAGTGCAIHLQKNLPLAAGIGGGSADAAAALHGLASIWQLPLPEAQVQLSLGADVPVCVFGQPARMRGTGGDITALHGLPDLPVVLVNPGTGISTQKVFCNLTGKSNDPVADWPQEKLSLPQTIDWLARQRNDLETTAIRSDPIIADVLAALELTDAGLARMSGSGATCFGIFNQRSFAERAAQTIAAEHPGWWVQPTVLRGSGHAGHDEI